MARRDRGESGAAVGGKRRRMIERAGVDVDAGDAVAPGEAERFGEQPAAVALPGELGDEADEGEFAFAGDAEIQLDHADFGARRIDHGVELADGRGELWHRP